MRWSTSRRSEVARRLVGALEGVPPARRRELALPPAARAPAVGGAARAADGIDLVIDPGPGVRDRRAPHHAALPGAAARARAGGALADWGCGSGVLAIAAAKARLGPRARGATGRPPRSRPRAANAIVNAVPEIAVERTTCAAAEGPWAPTVVANLVRPLLLEVAGVMDAPAEQLIVSGLLRDEADEVAAAFARHGLHEADRRHGGEWAALLLATG